MRHIILHGHIFKNAGTTFDWSLAKNFGAGFLDHRDDEKMLASGCEHLAQLVQDDPALKAISSHHMTRMFPEIPGIVFLPIYLLRHPLARMRSVYDFERGQQAETPGAVAARNKSFSDYISWRMQDDVRPVIRNYQTRYLAGRHGICPEREVYDSQFARAVQWLGSAAGVGIVECYDESMVVLEQALQAPFPGIDLSYVAQNQSADRAANASLDSVVSEILNELADSQRQVIDENSLDLALYRLACSQLQSRIERIEDFPAKLAAFRSRCQLAAQTR